MTADAARDLPVLYRDDALVAVVKASGLFSTNLENIFFPRMASGPLRSCARGS